MASTRWSRVYWFDLKNDVALNLCSLAAQGLWAVHMLPLCGLADRRGYLEVSGKVLDVAGLSRLAGRPAEEIGPLVEELEDRGVFSRDRRGCIYNRRLVRDALRAEVSQANGKKGGNPSLSKKSEILTQDNPRLKLLKPTEPTKPTESESRGAAVLPSSARELPPAAAPPEAAASRFSGKDFHPDYPAGIEVLERRLAFPGVLAWGPLNDWLQAGASLELVLTALTRVTERERAKDPAWQPRSLAYFADAVARARIEAVAAPRRVAPWWSGGNYGTKPSEAKRAGLTVMAHGQLRQWKEAHGFQLKMTRAPEVIAAAAAENIYMQTDED